MTQPPLTPHQSQYVAWLLTRRAASDTVESLASTLVDAQVDLNPHQVDAALFAFRNPLSSGVILADEVGLGKTIEAGLVISQRWAERKRRILIIVPANLRKQWHQELKDKFFLHGADPRSQVLQRASASRAAATRSEARDRVVICSYQFAKAKADDIKAIHVGPGRASTKPTACATSTRPATSSPRRSRTRWRTCTKLLLTATPLAELAAGALRPRQLHRRPRLRRPRELPRAVHQRWPRMQAFASLKRAHGARLQPHAAPAGAAVRLRTPRARRSCRSSRRRARSRTALRPGLRYLRRPNLQALPPSQRQLMTLVLRKLLASQHASPSRARWKPWPSGCKAMLRRARPAGRSGRRTRRGLRGAGRNRRGMDDGEDAGPSRRRARTSAPPSRTRSPTCAASRPGHQHPRQRQGQGAAQALDARVRRAGTAGRRQEGHHLHRVPPHAGLPAAPAGRQRRTATASCSSTAPTPTTRSQAIYADWLQAARRHRPHHRLEDRRHARRARRVLPRARHGS